MRPEPALGISSVAMIVAKTVRRMLFYAKHSDLTRPYRTGALTTIAMADRLLRDLQLAQMLVGGSGAGPPFPVDPWLVPGWVSLVESNAGGVLFWEFAHPAGAKDPRSTSDERNVLTEFQALAHASDDAVLRFAQARGPLYLCQHFRPISHAGAGEPSGAPQTATEAAYLDDRLALLDDLRGEGSLERGEGGCRLLKAEPVAVWRTYALRVRHVLQIAALLHQHRRFKRGARAPVGTAELWEEIIPSTDPVGQLARSAWTGSSPSLEQATQFVVLATDTLLRETGVRLRLTWDPGSSPELSFDGLGVLGAVARQLALVVIRYEGLGECDICGQFFTPKRRSQKRCGREACNREAGRRYTERSRAKSSRPGLGRHTTGGENATEE